MLAAPDLKSFLLGAWEVDRLVADRARGITGRLEGLASFTPSPGGLLYEERGTLLLGEHEGQAEQRYLFDFPEGDTRATVRFRDGRLFHTLDLRNGEDRVRHDCRPDLYEGLFTLLGPTAWRSEWKVTGPRKDYHLVTTYTRPTEKRPRPHANCR
jgi:hypothetical protein